MRPWHILLLFSGLVLVAARGAAQPVKDSRPAVSQAADSESDPPRYIFWVHEVGSAKEGGSKDEQYRVELTEATLVLERGFKLFSCFRRTKAWHRAHDLIVAGSKRRAAGHTSLRAGAANLLTDSGCRPPIGAELYMARLAVHSHNGRRELVLTVEKLGRIEKNKKGKGVTISEPADADPNALQIARTSETAPGSSTWIELIRSLVLQLAVPNATIDAAPKLDAAPSSVIIGERVQVQFDHTLEILFCELKVNCDRLQKQLETLETCERGLASAPTEARDQRCLDKFLKEVTARRASRSLGVVRVDSSDWWTPSKDEALKARFPLFDPHTVEFLGEPQKRSLTRHSLRRKSRSSWPRGIPRMHPAYRTAIRVDEGGLFPGIAGRYLFVSRAPSKEGVEKRSYATVDARERAVLVTGNVGTVFSFLGFRGRGNDVGGFASGGVQHSNGLLRWGAEVEYWSAPRKVFSAMGVCAYDLSLIRPEASIGAGRYGENTGLVWGIDLVVNFGWAFNEVRSVGRSSLFDFRIWQGVRGVWKVSAGEHLVVGAIGAEASLGF